MRWIGTVLKLTAIALWAALAIEQAFSAHWQLAIPWLGGVILMAHAWGLVRENRRLRANCGNDREADSVEHRDGVTIRYWYDRRRA